MGLWAWKGVGPAAANSRKAAVAAGRGRVARQWQGHGCDPSDWLRRGQMKCPMELSSMTPRHDDVTSA